MNLAILRISSGITVWVLKPPSGVPGKVFRALYKSIATGCSFVPISGTHMNHLLDKEENQQKKEKITRRKKKR